MKKTFSTTRAIAIALGATPLLFVLQPSAGASGAPSASVSPASAANTPTALTATSTLPKSKIVGAPSRFNPTALTATAIGTSTCTAADASFAIANKESTSQKIKLTGTDGLVPMKGSIAADRRSDICVSSGYTGVITVKLSDDNKLTVTF